MRKKNAAGQGDMSNRQAGGVMKSEAAGLPEHKVRLRVPFHDLDPLQMVWHGNYLKYFEIAREGLFRELGADLYDFHLKSGYLFPVIRSSVKHIRPLFHHDEFICRARLKESKRKLIVDFEIRLVKDNTLCAKGQSEQAAMKVPEMELMLLIPEALRNLLGR